MVSQINAFFIPLETVCWISCRQIWAQISAEVNFKDKCSFSFFLREPSQGVSKGFLLANCRDRMPFRAEHGILRVVVGVMRMLLRPFWDPPMGIKRQVKHFTFFCAFSQLGLDDWKPSSFAGKSRFKIDLDFKVKIQDFHKFDSKFFTSDSQVKINLLK